MRRPESTALRNNTAEPIDAQHDGARPRPKYIRRPTLSDLPDNVPKHVRHCHALGARDWWIWMWDKQIPGGIKTRVPYKCGSWRCDECKVHEAHVTWTRMRDAFQPYDPTGCCLLVLTLDRQGTYSGEKRWENAQAAYRELSALSNEFMKRLRKWSKRMGWAIPRNQWVATVECHRSGWPHVNFVIWSPELAKWLEDEKQAKMREGFSEQEANRVSGELADIVTGSGWGLISTAERARSAEESLGYITKVAGKVDESIGELAKLTQLPRNAPFRFRRLRSGKGFLPKRNKSEKFTGVLVRRQLSNDGTRDVLNLHNVKLEHVESSEECVYTEERIWYQELEAEHRCARQVRQFGRAAIELPPVTRWFRKQRVAEGFSRRANDNDDNRKPLISQLSQPDPVLHRTRAP